MLEARLEQAQLLKLVGHRTVEFRVRLKACWDASNGEVEEFDVEKDDDKIIAEVNEDGPLSD